MKKIFLNVLVFLPMCVYSQPGELPLYFREPQPSGEVRLEKIPSAFTGTFRSTKDTLKTLHVEEDSVYTSISSVHILTLDQVKELNLEIRGNKLLGIGNDTVEVLKKNDTVYFWLIQNYTFFVFDSAHAACETENGLFVNLQKENRNWEIILFERDGIKNTLTLKYIDTELEAALIKKIKDKKRMGKNDQAYVVASQGTAEWENYIGSDGFSQEEIFIKREDAD